MLESSPHIFLTGAGFTHNFGGPLATEMWAQIFSHPSVQKSPDVLRLMRRDFDFESVYHEVMTDDAFQESDRKNLAVAVMDVYMDIDTTAGQYAWGNRPPIMMRHVQQLINDIAGEDLNRAGYFFTLNQDLFVERQYYNSHIFHPITLPCVDHNTYKYAAREEPKPFTLPDALHLKNLITELHQSKSRLFYIKLHGSQNWVSPRLGGQMVVGRTKVAHIQSEPLLTWYFELFESILKKPNRLLLCVGYGFRDDHVNRIISEAVENRGLMLHIIDPNPPDHFKSNLPEQYRAIWEGLAGYHQCNFEQLFRSQSESTPHRLRLYRTFFGRDPLRI